MANIILAIKDDKIKELLTFPEDIPQEIVKLIHSCWEMDPSQRPFCQEIVNSLVNINCK